MHQQANTSTTNTMGTNTQSQSLNGTASKPQQLLMMMGGKTITDSAQSTQVMQ
jgi:hypothetical protein